MTFELYKQLVGVVAIAICFVQYVPMLVLTIQGRKQPHAFTRLIWALCLGITFTAQWIGKGGAGSWPTGVSCAFCIAISIAAARKGKTYITRSDWLFFFAALLAIPMWVISDDPLEAVIWAATIDFLGYLPTFRKSWHRPNDEMLGAFTLGCLKQLMGVTALETYSWVTLFYPVASLTFDFAFIGMVAWRRYVLRPLI